MWPNWFSFDTVKWLIATAAIPATLAVLAQSYESAQSERQTKEARLRLYTELLSKREEADTSVRRGIFDKVLDTYLKPKGQDLDAKLVALELLAFNFNDSLDLSPLFWQLDQEIRQLAPRAGRSLLKTKLERIATGVKDRQIELLEFVGDKQNAGIDVSTQEAKLYQRIDRDFTFPDPNPTEAKARQPEGHAIKRHFQVEVAEHDPVGRRVLVRVDIGVRQWMFWVDVFDFPLVNFTRISKSERFTVLLSRYDPPKAELTAIYFPSSRSGVKDKPFIDEVIANLRD